MNDYDDDEMSIGSLVGPIQIIVACLSIAAGVMAILYGAGYYYVGIGIWAGIVYLIAGSLALAAGKNPTNSLITATLVFSVLNIIVGFAQITIASFGVTVELDCTMDSRRNQDGTCVDWWELAFAANWMMILVGFYEIGPGICMTVISGRTIRKRSKPPCPVQPSTATQIRSGLQRGHCSGVSRRSADQLRVKDLPKIHTRRLEVDSSLEPSGFKATTPPLHHRDHCCISSISVTVELSQPEPRSIHGTSSSSSSV